MTQTIPMGLDGAGIFYLTGNSDDIFGVWYSSTVSCKKDIYALPFRKGSIRTIGLLDLINAVKPSKIKLLQLKDRSKEALFRSYVYSSVISNDDPDKILEDILEKSVFSSSLPLNNYLGLVNLIHKLKKSEHSDCLSDQIDERLKETLQKLQPYFDKTNVGTIKVHKRPADSRAIIEQIEAALFNRLV